MKKKLVLMCIAGALVMTAVIGGTLAGFNTSTENQGITNITVNTLGIEWKGNQKNTEQIDATTVDDIKAVPGGEIVLNYSIVNNVEGGYELYARVTIDKKWANKSLDPEKIHLYVGVGEEKKELVEGEVVNNWIVWHVDKEQFILYYQKPLSAGEETTNVVDTISFDADIDNEYADQKVELNFRADAVQAAMASDSMPSEWGIYPVISEDGTIISIEE
ncbi:MAG: hypothetical protein KIG50_01635 [Lachnospiraceae bacterium]|nr:hypothetical protein [Lachnospiraceae bacterium]